MAKGPKARPMLERWVEFVEVTPTCWLWTGSTNNMGYGRLYSVDRDDSVYAHRFAYEVFVGPIPANLVLDHLCSVRRCVCPDHLEPVTQRENNIRAHRTNGTYKADTHGETACYRAGCRCAECRAANAAQHLAWWHGRKQ